MSKMFKQTYDLAMRHLPLRGSMLALLLLQVFLTHAQTIQTASPRLQVVACEDLSISLSDFNQNCENAEACFIVEGGTPPYTVIATAGPNSQPITANPNFCFFHLEPFTSYIVTLTDAEGCTASTELNLPGDNDFDAEITNVTCHGGSDGRIEPIIPIDLAPLFYRWLGPNGFVSEDEILEGVPAGTYRLRLTTTDNLCVGVSTWTVTQPNAIEMEVSITQPGCALASACVTAEGGTAPYTVWGFSILPQVLVGHTTGQITDLSDLDTPDSFVFTQTSANGAACAGELPNGTYYFLVVDANNCYYWDDVHVESPAFFTRQREVKHVDCHGGSNGKICFSISGGTEPFSTTLSPPGMNVGITATQGCFENLSAGVYTLSTLDGENCLLSQNIVVQQPNLLTAEFEVTSGSCDANGLDGCLTIEGGTGDRHATLWRLNDPNGGVPDVIFDGDDAFLDGATFMNNYPFLPVSNVGNVRCVQNVPPGVYYILVTDARHCYTLVRLEVPEIDNPITATFALNNTSPCSGPASGCLTVEGGEGPYQFYVWRWNSPLPVLPQVHFNNDGVPFIDGAQPTDALDLNPSPNQDNVWCAQNIPSGYYLILVLDANGCYVLVPANVTASGGLSVEAEVRGVGCNGQESRIKLTIEGGTAPYQIFQNISLPPVTIQTNMYVVEGLPVGTYSFTIYDAFQCSTAITVVIDESGALDLNLEFDPFGEEACVSPEGGVSPYQIRWYNLNNNSQQPFADGLCVHNLAPGVYRVWVRDANGCESEAIFFIDENPCAGGEAHVDPGVIQSGQSTTFVLSNWSGQSLQWQFKTELTGWINIPGATSATYHTPPMHSGSDRVIQVRALVMCDGEVWESEPSQLTILGSNLLPPSTGNMDAYLFNPEYQMQLAALANHHSNTALVQVFPTISSSQSQLRFLSAVSGTVRISLISSMGAVMSQKTLTDPVTGDMTELILSELPQGVYFVCIEHSAGVQTERIIVNR